MAPPTQSGNGTMDPGSEKSQGVLSAGEEMLGVQGVGGEEVHAGIGYFANQTGGGTGPGRGRHSDPFWVACLLACLLSRSLRLSLLDLHLWTHFLLVPFRVLFSPSLSLHSSHHFAWSIEQNQPLCPFRSVSAQHRLHLHRRLPSSPPQNLPQALHARPPKRGPLDLAAARANQRNSISSIRSPPGKTVPCPSSSPQAIFLCFETQPSKHRPSSAILGSPTDDDAPSAAASESSLPLSPP